MGSTEDEGVEQETPLTKEQAEAMWAGLATSLQRTYEIERLIAEAEGHLVYQVMGLTKRQARFLEQRLELFVDFGGEGSDLGRTARDLQATLWQTVAPLPDDQID